MIDPALVRRQVAVAGPIRKPAKAVRVGWVGIGERGRKELAGLQVRDPNNPPSSENLIDSPRRVVHEPSPAAKGQLPNRVKHQAVFSCEVTVPKLCIVGIIDVQKIRHIVGPGPMSVESYPTDPPLRREAQRVIVGAPV